MKTTRFLLCVGAASTLLAQPLPAPKPVWEEWVPVATCGGVIFEVAKYRYDGRNDVAMKARARYGGSSRVAFGAKIVAVSADARTESREFGGNVGGGGEVSRDFGAPFPSPVNRLLPYRVTNISVADVRVGDWAFDPKIPAAYYNPLSDPKATTRCGRQSRDYQQPPRFIALTESCISSLPLWTDACDEAVDEIVPLWDRSPADRECLKEWREYQLCFGIYATNADPDPKPRCDMPLCEITYRDP